MKRKLVQSLKLLILVEYTMETEIIGFYPIKKASNINTKSISPGRLFSNSYPGSAIVAPSVPDAYNQIQDAIDDGYYDVWLCEDIEEDNIKLPTTEEENIFRLRGMSQEARPTIKDPQNGNPVITKQEGRHHWVVLQDFRIKGGENSVRTIDTAVSKRSYRPGTWKLRNIIAYGGTAHLVGPRFTLENCHFKNISSIPEEYYGKTVYPAIRSLGATFGIWGSYTTDRGTDATVISSGAFSISGGVTFLTITAICSMRKPILHSKAHLEALCLVYLVKIVILI